MENLDFSDSTTLFIAIAIGVVFLAGITLALREVWCWYFKFNRIVKNQNNQIELLYKQIDLLSLIALKHRVPDTKIYDAITRELDENLVSKGWIEQQHDA